MTDSAPETKRLHITPFNPELLPSVLPPTIRLLATEISFHCVPTFPENNYGYVTLPTMEAEKIKKKLNGSILKGRKFKVDTARPLKRQRTDDETVDKPAANPSSDKKAKKRRAAEEILEGFEIPADRKVKRGWTESADAKQDRRKEEKRHKKTKDGKNEKSAKTQARSKYTEKEECLFRTKLPLNRVPSADEKQEKQSKKKQAAHETIVHEFSKTVKHPSFLRSGRDDSVDSMTFVDGKGWMDRTGNVKEPVSDRIRTDQYRPGCVPGAKEKPRFFEKNISSIARKPTAEDVSNTDEASSTNESEDWTSSSGASSSEEDSSSDGNPEESESDDSSSSRSSGQPEESNFDEEQESLSGKQGGTKATVAASHSPDHQRLPSFEKYQAALGPEVHPLEALFKRPAPDACNEDSKSEERPQFSFFGGQNDIDMEEETEGQSTAPLTPFTKRDLRDRELRSAAPTPDTGVVVRTIDWNKQGQHQSLNIDEDEYATTPISKAAFGSKEDSDFVKWFWENRGDNNRAWKRRRREAAKEQRQRENRSKGMKGKS
ncbi:uncharacterized protein BP01DRAFT_355671 [Aspergillus saccharolyticus JOP 1030-1]|uniref:Suppressor protein SRP40 n=1 Tax=Aspergillus saccharolyticus JOP 1030-1 TaxID=1450539 RepID=A0A318ZGI8_9EURO|nr:hypothetical protein BP01DRAFT_355671 [Aspergillus saccharolyticus JOP 1030-1]PYH46676.1 hypothetical protein BP01DRAFT_355671 [Aspergillus saccharolyticus JOP 1030-1]